MESGVFACSQRHQRPAKIRGKAMQTAKLNHNSSFPIKTFTAPSQLPSIHQPSHSPFAILAIGSLGSNNCDTVGPASITLGRLGEA